jgi:hypothetical protein
MSIKSTVVTDNRINAIVSPPSKIVPKNVVLHDITAASVGLENVDNTSDINKPISTATQTALDSKANQSTTYTKTEVNTQIAGAGTSASSELTAHANLTNNPHGVDATQVGLGSVENKSSATIRSEIVDGDIPSTIARDSELPTKSSLGLSNVDNESKAVMFTDPTFTGNVLLENSTNNNKTFIKEKSYGINGSFQLQRGTSANENLAVFWEGPASENLVIRQYLGEDSGNAVAQGQIKFLGDTPNGSNTLRLDALNVDVGFTNTVLTKIYSDTNIGSNKKLVFTDTRDATDGLQFNHSGANELVQMGMYGSYGDTNIGEFKITHKNGQFAANTDILSIAPTGASVTIHKPTTFTGNPQSNAAPSSADHLTNKTYVDAQVAGIVDSAPEALNTLNELAEALGDDQNFATTTATSIGEKLAKASNLLDLANVATAKTNLGLGNVDNTTDTAKPVSTAQQTALDLKANLASPSFTGSVGIGTTTPQNKLHVVETSAGNVTYPIRIQNDNITNNSGVGIEFGISTNDDYTNARIQATREDNQASAELSFQTRFDANTNLTERMRIDRNGNVGIGTTSPTCALDMDGHFRLLVSPENRIDGQASALIKGTNGRAANLRVVGPVTVTHDLFKNSGDTGGFADNSNHFHTVQKINRITQQSGSGTPNERVQEQYYAIENNNLKNSKAAFWNWHRVSKEVSSTSVSLTNLVGWDVSDIQDSSNRTADSQVLFPTGGAEATTFTFDTAGNNPFTNGDVLRITISIDFAGAIVAATNFAKVTAVSGTTATVVLYGGNYKTTIEVPKADSQDDLTTGFSIKKIDTAQYMPLASGTGIDVLSDSTRTTTTDTFKITFASVHGLELNDTVSIITDNTGGFQAAEVAFVKSVGSTTEATFIYGRVFEPESRLELSDIGSGSVVGVLKGTLDGLHRFTAGDQLMHFNADNEGRYKSYQIGPGSEVGADCIAIGKNVYNKDASTIKIGYDNNMLNIDSAGIDVAGNITASGSVTGATLAGTLSTAAQPSITTVGTIGTGTWQGTAIADAYISSASTWNGKQDALTFGTASGNALKSEEALAENNILLAGASNVKGRTYSELKTDLGLGTAAETDSTAYATAAQGTLADDALAASAVSTFGGQLIDDTDAATARTTLGLGTAATTASTAYAPAAGGSSITTVGTIGTGTWQGTAIADAYVGDLTTSKITSGTFADARISSSSVTQHSGDITSVGTLTSLTVSGDVNVSTAPTSGNHLTNKTYVDTQVAGVVNSAPEALNTLNELAEALGDDASFATTTATSIGEKLAKASNLSDLNNVATARTNLGLGSAATTDSTAYAPAAGGSSITSVGTLTGLTVSGAVTIDSQTLTVDSSNDRVGVGIAGPMSKLHVRDSSSGNVVRQLRLHNEADALNTGAGIVFEMAGSSDPSVPYVNAAIDSVDTESGLRSGNLIFSTRPNNTGGDAAVIERMRINATGEVGIGKTATAGVELDVSGDIAASGSVSTNTVSAPSNLNLTAGSNNVTMTGAAVSVSADNLVLNENSLSISAASGGCFNVSDGPGGVDFLSGNITTGVFSITGELTTSDVVNAKGYSLNANTFTVVSTTSTLAASTNGLTVILQNTGPITITLPTLAAGHVTTFISETNNAVTFVGDTGITVNSFGGNNTTAGIFAQCQVIYKTTTVAFLGGNLV